MIPEVVIWLTGEFLYSKKKKTAENRLPVTPEKLKLSGGQAILAELADILTINLRMGSQEMAGVQVFHVDLGHPASSHLTIWIYLTSNREQG